MFDSYGKRFPEISEGIWTILEEDNIYDCSKV